MKLAFIVLCLGTLVLAAPAPQQRNTIDFLLEQNPDVLDQETPASVQPLPQPQIGTTTTGTPASSQDPAPVYEEQAEVREAPREVTPNASELSAENESTAGAADSDEDSQNNSESVEQEEEKHTEPAVTEEHEADDHVQDTTIRVYDDEELGHEEASKPTEEPNQQQDEKIEDHQNGHEDPIQHHGDEEVTKVQQQAEEQEEQQDHTTTLAPIQLDSTTVGGGEHVELDSDRLFNHGTLILEKGTLSEQELKVLSTTPAIPFNKWDHDHKFGPPGFPPKFGFPGHHHHHDHEHDHDHDHDHHFGGPPPPWMRGQHFEGPPPSWHHHHHDHDQHHEHDHDHDHEHDHDHDHHRHGPGGNDGFYGHGFHRANNNWKWH